eukprot:TRINITY_DN3622_c0_g1_i1.p1 TRINITY_DN3622_c0_g1~~TRINITY_DN3622_c0_g1_i1.p1  ORF type:complete len:630 (+),score=113.31 TRINITY_DN3622_c0_g1_i1:65-1891(+)
MGQACARRASAPADAKTNRTASATTATAAKSSTSAPPKTETLKHDPKKYSNDYSRFADIVDSDEEKEKEEAAKNAADEDEEAWLQSTTQVARKRRGNSAGATVAMPLLRQCVCIQAFSALLLTSAMPDGGASMAHKGGHQLNDTANGSKWAAGQVVLAPILRGNEMRTEKTVTASTESGWPKFNEVLHWLKDRLEALFWGPSRNHKAAEHCSMTASERCPMTGFRRSSAGTLEGRNRETVAVRPGGNTRCLDNSEYFFEVTPGDRGKLMIYFQGGGACWALPKSPGREDAAFHLCTETASGGQLADQLKSQVFKDYTIVNVMYCSGDAHVGAVDGYFGEKLAPQRGYHNALAAVNWALENTRSELSSLVLAGSSAGALGVVGWAHTILSSFEYRQASVVMDSHAGIFPDGIQEKRLRAWGMCTSGLLTLPDAQRCKATSNALTVQDLTESAIRRFPDVKFVHINSKQDIVQRAFYDALLSGEPNYEGKSTWMRFLLTSPKFYVLMNKVMERYEKYANHAFYLVDGSQHMFLAGPLADLALSPGLGRWLQKAVEHSPLANECTGVCQYWTEDAQHYWERVMNQWRLFGPQDWCDAKLHVRCKASAWFGR